MDDRREDACSRFACVMRAGQRKCRAEDPKRARKANVRIDLPFNMASTNVVHMTVKPADIIDDDEAANAKSTGKAVRQRETEEQGAGCRCVIL